MKQELTAQEANKLAVEQQVIYVKQLVIALQFTFKGKHWLNGKEVDAHTLAMAQKQLVELDRVKQLFESGKYAKLPYLASNGTSDSRVAHSKEGGLQFKGFTGEKTKAHLNSSGTVNFIEVTQSTKSAGVESHTKSKGLVKKQLSQFSKNNKTKSSNEATNMATKKANKPSKQTLKASKQPYAVKGKTNAERIREAYHKNPKTFNVAEFSAKSGIPYNLVYGCITKEKAKGTSKKNNSKPVTKKKAAKVEAAK